MYIKSIEINGFKSYGKKTEIKGFDKSFNAITGFNGSGKSNILDSICFVLGITNIKQVRASSLDELVYKNGQAGVTKAAVSITFDNTDRHASPLGYENHKEITVTRMIVIGGRNKYLINGIVATNHKVADLFQSVQLNVNNPHFLIMQGRVTKVLNMKPLEVLSMVEEAAGTRMYETKRENSIKHIKRKDERLAEINKIIEEEIYTNLETLKEQRKEFLEFSKISREVEHLSKVHTAYKFVKAQKNCSNFNEEKQKFESELKQTKENIENLKKTIDTLNGKIAEMEKKKDEEAGGQLQILENVLKEKQMAESKVSNSLQNLNNSLKEENKKKGELIKHFNEDKNSLANKEKDIEKLGKRMESLKTECEADQKSVTTAEKHLHAVNAGMVSNTEGEEATIAAQIIAAKEDITKAQTDENVAERNFTHLKKEIAKKESECKEADGTYKKNKEQYQALEKELQKLKQEISKLGYIEGKKEHLDAEKVRIDRELYSLKQRIDSMQSRFPQLSFDYSDPVQNFDRKKVHGLVCRLIKAKDPATLTALEIAAGNKLYNVVVDNDATGKLLLSKGQLKQRCTIIPLNKINGYPIHKDVIAKAERLVGKENVSTALSLITYDKSVQAAVEYAFGGVFICRDMDSAKKVSFAEGILKKSVTLDGDSFDPSGTLSGGSMGNRTKILTELAKLNSLEEEFLHTKHLQNNVIKELHQINAVAEKFNTLRNNIDIKEGEMSSMKTSLEQSQYYMQMEELKTMKNSLAQQQATLSSCKTIKKNAEKQVEELKQKQKNAKSTRDQELKNAKQALTCTKEKLANSEREFKKCEQNFNQAKLEAEDIAKSIINTEQQIAALHSTIEEHERMKEDVENELNTRRQEVAQFSEEVKSQKAILKAHSAEINKYYKEKEDIKKNIDNLKLHIQQLEHDISKSTSDSEAAANNVREFLRAYDWIEEQKKYFGVPNTEFDFHNYDERASAVHLSELEQRKQKLSKQVNVRAQNMIKSVEDRYKILLDKKRIVLNDKEKIQKVIEELDERKKAAVRIACERVNVDFGSIFSTLLPGAKAKLVPPEGKTVLDGLEFKVGFGGLWKESLTELSGGQRSLVALSLILAMLLFKPAPIYILDEVDAALDPSHTGNIGAMLKKHFKQSQFIVVSLRDGMFNNANVLFRTKFVDGMSSVDRFSQN